MNLSSGKCRTIRPFSGQPSKCDVCGWVCGDPVESADRYEKSLGRTTSTRVHATTPIYKELSVYYKDPACKDRFYDQNAAAVLWRDKQRTDHTLRAFIEDGVTAVAKFIGIVLVFTLGVFLWQQSAVEGWRSHDELTTLASGPWANGEYKDCTSLNFKEPKVLMTCDGVFGVEGKVFKVRFYGLTRFEDKPESFQSSWQCRKNGDGDPAVTCEIGK